MNYYKPTRLELFLLICILVGMSGVGYMLYINILQSTRAQVAEPLRLGQIIAVQGDVKIRPSDSFMWDDARPKLYIVDKDKVFNGQQANSKILLIDKTMVELGPNTLVQFFRSQSGTVGIDVTSGSLNIDSSLSTQTPLLQLSGQSQEIDCANIDTHTTDGATGKVDLQRRIVCRQGAQKEVLAYKGMTPTQDEKIYDVQPFVIKWRKVTEGAIDNMTLVIEKLDNNTFSLLEKVPLSPSSEFSHQGLPPGTYQWHLEGENVKLSHTQPFRVIALPFPDILNPKEDVVTYGQSLITHFQWQKKFGTEKVHLQVAKDPEFKQLIIDHTTTYGGYEITPSEATDLLASKLFYWRVIPLLEEFDVLANPHVKIPVQHTRVVDALSKIFPPNDHLFDSPEKMQTVTFHWPEIKDGKYYFELVDVDNRILSSRNTTTGEITVERIPPGSYQWKVTRMNDQFPQQILFSQSFDIIAKLSAEELLHVSTDEISYETKQNTTAPLHWDIELKFLKTNFIIENFDISLVQATDNTLVQKLDRQITSTKKFVYRDLEPQKYKLQFAQKGTNTVALSYPIDLSASPIGPPSDIHFVLESDETSRILRMHWNRVQHAQAYEVRIYQQDSADATPHPIKKVLTTEGTSLTLIDEDLFGKQLQILATAVDPAGRSSLPIEKNYVMRE